MTKAGAVGSCGCGRHRSPQGCAGARQLRARTARQRREQGREGGRANAVVDRADILARYAGLERDQAILAAWRDARRIQRYARFRARRKGGA
jgi:hypothetical protein